MSIMLGLIRPSFSSALAPSLRFIHASSRAYNLIAPPDPVSHLRPIIYDDAPAPPTPSFIRHPYSLSEFTTGPQNQAVDSELQYKLQRQQLDAYHQNFWLDSNTRFEAAKHAILESLPSSSTVVDKENALSEFYKQWYLQESSRTSEYTIEWRRRNLSIILLGARVEYQKLANSVLWKKRSV